MKHNKNIFKIEIDNCCFALDNLPLLLTEYSDGKQQKLHVKFKHLNKRSNLNIMYSQLGSNVD